MTTEQEYGACKEEENGRTEVWSFSTHRLVLRGNNLSHGDYKRNITKVIFPHVCAKQSRTAQRYPNAHGTGYHWRLTNYRRSAGNTSAVRAPLRAGSSWQLPEMPVVAAAIYGYFLPGQHLAHSALSHGSPAQHTQPSPQAACKHSAIAAPLLYWHRPTQWMNQWRMWKDSIKELNVIFCTFVEALSKKSTNVRNAQCKKPQDF